MFSRPQRGNLPKTPAGSHICSKNCERCFHDPSGVALNFKAMYSPKVEGSLPLRSVTKASRPTLVYRIPKKWYYSPTLLLPLNQVSSTGIGMYIFISLNRLQICNSPIMLRNNRPKQLLHRHLPLLQMKEINDSRRPRQTGILLFFLSV
jgi:hypothetical protein